MWYSNMHFYFEPNGLLVRTQIRWAARIGPMGASLAAIASTVPLLLASAGCAPIRQGKASAAQVPAAQIRL